MISAWKRFINKNALDNDLSTNNGHVHMPPGIQKIDKELQRKFARGINYNMKVIIKGDNKVGKTSLFLRLKGYGFEERYIPTETLNVTSIDWNYKATHDVVKIDLWEAVDSASRKNVNFVDLKLENTGTRTPGDDGIMPNSANGQNKQQIVVTSAQLNQNGNDNIRSPIPESAKQSLAELSENFDVYRGADAVLLMMDMTKSWTFKYVQAELPKIPKHIPVLVIGNHRDQGHHRTISAFQVKSFLDGLAREPNDGTIMYTETSMKNGFGMRLVERFFNIPFLKLQEASLLKQLEVNRYEGLATFEELQILHESLDREYEQYLEWETIKRRQQADAMSPVNLALRQLDETTREQIRNTSLSSDTVDKRANATSIESTEDKKSSPHIPKNFVNDRLPSIVIGAKCPLPTNAKSILVGKDNSSNQENSKVDNDETSDDSDEDEEPKANPLVANYQSDVDSDDQER